MERINFEDGVTKGNATTFNQLQDNMEEAITPNIMRVALNATQYIKTSDDFVFFNTVTQHLGNKLTFENGSIKIGKGVNHIKASCDLWVEAQGDSYSIVVLHRQRNDALYSISRSMFPKRTGIGDAWCTQSISQTLIDVQEGDIIRVGVIFSVPNDLNCVSGIYANCSTMQVEVVD